MQVKKDISDVLVVVAFTSLNYVLKLNNQLPSLAWMNSISNIYYT